jgi:hypothetical protein
MKGAIGLLLFATTLILSAWIEDAHANPGPFSGAFTLDEAASDDVMAAFEPAIRDMNAVVRPVARRRIRRDARPSPTLRIDQDAHTITLRPADQRVLTAPLSGDPVQITTKAGNPASVTIRLIDGTLHVRRTEEAGSYQARYQLSPDGQRLTIAVELDYDQLPKTVRYNLVYNRQAP